MLFHTSKGLRLVLLVLGLLTISLGAVLVIATAQTTMLIADHDLTNYWRTTYDILVRPTGQRSLIEEKYGLVEANHISGIAGGISISQYEAIKNIPGVEVAAPLAMIGYIPEFASYDLPKITDPGPGAYVKVERYFVDGSEYSSRFTYYFNVPDISSYGSFDPYSPNVPIINQTDYLQVNMEFPFLIAGIDPIQEAALINLDQALVIGEYLVSDELLVQEPFTSLGGEGKSPKTLIRAPVLVNKTSYIDMRVYTEVKHLTLPPDISTIQDLLARGGNKYLATLPGETLISQEMDSRELYDLMVKSLSVSPPGGGAFLWDVPSQIEYHEIPSASFSNGGLTLEINLPGGSSYAGKPAYRKFSFPGSDNSFLNVALTTSVRGLFDIEHLPKPVDINRVPLETYFPPISILRYDEQGNPVVPPHELRPTFNPSGYIQSPPLMLTTLQAAQILRGDKAISAIRVRVALEGCTAGQPKFCSMTPASQRKIEAIAIEIQRQTGLDVDIMVGSSPRRVLVHVPGIGYVEEQWIQKGVNLVYKQGIQSGNWLFVGTLLLAGGLFTLDLAWAEVVAKRRILALQKALGWRSRTVFGQILGQILSLATGATLIGILIALGVMRLLKWQQPPNWVLLGLPSTILVVVTLGCFFPAWLASRTPPLIGLRQAGMHNQRSGNRPVLDLWEFAKNGLLRRPGRTLLAGLTAVLSAGLLVLLLAVMMEQRGLMSGTLLGEFIMVRIQGFHYAIVGIGFFLAAFSTANSLLAGILERRQEIGVLKAMGWRTGAVMGLFVIEGVMLGLAGGAVGTILGSLVFVYLYHTIAPGLALAMLVGVGVPGLVGALASLYPALLASRVTPAEAVRYE
jgi:hypothetical protein